jgi:hypothetical protein
MEWFIEGADASTGEDLQLVIEADDAPAAEEQARERGMLISTISPVGMAMVAEQSLSASAVALEVEESPVDEPVAEIVEEPVQETPVDEPQEEPPPPVAAPAPKRVKPKKSMRPPAAAPVVHSPAPLEYANLKGSARPNRNGEPTDYSDITHGSKTLRILATVASIIGGACFALAIFVLIFPFIQDDATHFSIPLLLTSAAAALTPAAFGLCLLITAAVLRLIASVALAVRDIARNSHQR